MLWWVKITNQLASPRTGRCSHQFTGVRLLLTCSFTSPPPQVLPKAQPPASVSHPSSLCYCSFGFLAFPAHSCPSTLLAPHLPYRFLPTPSPPLGPVSTHLEGEGVTLGQGVCVCVGGGGHQAESILPASPPLTVIETLVDIEHAPWGGGLSS